MTSQHTHTFSKPHYVSPGLALPHSPTWPISAAQPITPKASAPKPSAPLSPTLFESDSNASPPCNQPRFSDVTAGPSTPSNFMLTKAGPPSASSPYSSSPHHPNSLQFPPTSPPMQYHSHFSDPSYRRANPPLTVPPQIPRPPAPSNNHHRLQNAPHPAFNLSDRLTSTEPPMLSPKHQFQRCEAALAQQIPVLPPKSSSISSSNPPSRPDTPSDAEPKSSQNPSDRDRPTSSPPKLEHLNAHVQEASAPVSSNHQSPQLLVSSAEPSSTHIDPAGLEYDFGNINTRIGVGTYGSVYLGRYFGEHVAIKRISIPSASSSASADPFVCARNAEAIRRFAREIRRYERVNHPGVVRFFGVTLPPDSSALLISEFMQGGSLGEAIGILRRSGISLNISSAIRIAMQVCGGLRALHIHECIWGDAKPENILLSEAIDTNGVFPQCAEARIADFGLSKSVGQTLLGDTTLSGSGQPAGTYNYVAPEMFSDDDSLSLQMAKAADVFSFGLVLYEMLTLRTPWKRRSMMEAFACVRRGDRPAWPASSDPDFYHAIPKEIKCIVERCWHRDPKKRPDAESLFHGLEKINGSMSDIYDQRPVTDLTQTPKIVSSGTSNAHGINSVQSEIPSVVAIGELPSEYPNMQTESVGSRNAIDNSDSGSMHSNSSVTVNPPTSRRNPAVSPVTSPDHCHKSVGLTDSGDGELPFGSGSQLVPVKKLSKFLGDKDLEVISPKVRQDPLLVSREDGLETIDPSGKVGTSFESTPSMGQYKSNFQFPTLPPKEFPKYDKQLDEFVIGTAKAAVKIMEKNECGDMGAGWGVSMNSSSCPSGLTNTIAMNNFTMKAILEGSSTSSNASLSRKRSKRLQQIIEQAAEAFLELRRREQRTPPKQRREAIEKQAVEEAQATLERDVLKEIDEAKEKNDFSKILKILEHHRESLSVVKSGFSVLENFCKNERTFFDICEEGGVEALVSGATLYGNQDASLAISFCHCVHFLSEHYDDKVGHMVRGLGAPTLVVELLEHHRTDVEVQIAGCDCLAVVASSSELSRSAVATLGGPRAVYRAMTKNNVSFKDVRLAKAALKAIKSIAHDNEKAADYLVQAAALDTVSHAADVFTCDGLEKDILMALRAFAFYDDGRRNIIMRSGLKALTHIMVRNNEPEFLVQCCTFIRSIARWRDHECEGAMLHSSISERIVHLMQMSNDIPGEDGAKVAWYASHACVFLASFGSRSRQRLRELGAIETSVHVMKAHMGNARVVHAATDALAEILKGEPEAKRHAERCNVACELNQALARHYNMVKTRNAVQWTLEHLLSQPTQGSVPAQGQQSYQSPAPPQVSAGSRKTAQPEKGHANRLWRWNRNR